jgi:ribulose-5-phosphate 4-epimerase/fuculose-1-phosphate aldolase
MPKPITSLDRDTISQLRKSLHAALTKFAQAHGLDSASVGNISYSSTSFTAKIEFMLADAEETEFARHAALVGLRPEDYGRLITVDGREFRVVGVDPRCRKYPVTVRCSDGKVFKMNLNTVNTALNRKPQA